jgi:hypothetical protein
MDGMVPVRRPYAILGARAGRPLQHVGCKYVAKVIAKLAQDAFGVEQQLSRIENSGPLPRGQ